MDPTVIAFILILLFHSSDPSYYDDVEPPQLSKKKTTTPTYDDEPLTNVSSLLTSTPMPQNLYCERFAEYALNCTISAALMYNSSRKAPPMPARMNDWCLALRHLEICARDWNQDCKDVTGSHFNEASIAGHNYVITNICNDEIFLSRYDELPDCLDQVMEQWEACYTKFKSIVDYQKNTSKEWTHYEPHFYLCCARAHFRRCTLDLVFNERLPCTRQQGLTLQRFSVVVSEGDVYQDCSFNMAYQNCPGGDPRPTSNMLTAFVTEKPKIIRRAPRARSSAKECTNNWFSLFLTAIYMILDCSSIFGTGLFSKARRMRTYSTTGAKSGLVE